GYQQRRALPQPLADAPGGVLAEAEVVAPLEGEADGAARERERGQQVRAGQRPVQQPPARDGDDDLLGRPLLCCRGGGGRGGGGGGLAEEEGSEAFGLLDGDAVEGGLGVGA